MSRNVDSQSPKCANCGRPAIVSIDGYPACIDCQYKFNMSQWMQFAQHATMENHASAEIDARSGMGPISPKIQIPRAPVPPINYNNQSVSVSGGNVGAINFGNVSQIQVSLQSLAESGAPDIVEPLTKLTDSILNAHDADEGAKNELLEQIATLSALANTQPQERKPGIIKALLAGIREGTATISSASGAWVAVEPLLKGHFGL